MTVALQAQEWQEWPLALTINQVSPLLGLSRSSILRLVDEGVLDGLEFGSIRTRMISRGSVVKVLQLT